MNYKTSKKGQRGQALILIAFAAIGLFAFSALAIDGSRAFSNKRHAQNAADTSALTAALKYIRTSGSDTAKYAAAVDAAKARAKDNGFDPLNPGASYKLEVQVYVQRCSETTDLQTGQPLVCDGLPAGITTAQKAEFIRVRIVSTIPTTFGRVIGRQSLTSAAEAIARVQGGGTSSSGSFGNGAAMVATRAGNIPDCLKLNGGADVYTHNSGVYINCSNQNTIFMNDNIKFEMDAMGQVVGCYNDNNIAKKNPPPYDPIQCGANGGQSIPEATYEAQFALVPKMPATLPTCSGFGTASGGNYQLSNGDLKVNGGTVTITAGNYAAITVNNGDLVMKPGNYCISGDFNVNSSGSDVTAPDDGTVRLVMGNSSFNPGNGQNFDFDDLEVYTVNGNIDVKGILTADRFRFYSSGNGVFKTNSGAKVTSDDAYIYLANGYPNWNSQSAIVLTAPKTVDSFGDVRGMVLHMPWSNTNPVDLNGGATTNVHGTFLMPHSYVTFNGGTDFKLYSQIIAYYFTVNGGGTVDIWYNASENYNPPSAPASTIELTK